MVYSIFWLLNFLPCRKLRAEKLKPHPNLFLYRTRPQRQRKFNESADLPQPLDPHPSNWRRKNQVTVSN